MILAASSRALLDAFEQQVPDVMAAVRPALRLSGLARQAYLADAYPDLPVVDFSRDIVAHTPGLRVLVWPDGIGWTDLGTPERLRAWLSSGARPRPSWVAQMPDVSGVAARH
jgi:hypothetical protein